MFEVCQHFCYNQIISPTYKNIYLASQKCQISYYKITQPYRLQYVQIKLELFPEFTFFLRITGKVLSLKVGADTQNLIM